MRASGFHAINGIDCFDRTSVLMREGQPGWPATAWDSRFVKESWKPMGAASGSRRSWISRAKGRPFRLQSRERQGWRMLTTPRRSRHPRQNRRPKMRPGVKMHAKTAKTTCIAYADDDVRMVRHVRTTLEKVGYRVVTATDGPSAIEMVETEDPDLLVLDLTMPGMDGIEVLRRLRE